MYNVNTEYKYEPRYKWDDEITMEQPKPHLQRLGKIHRFVHCKFQIQGIHWYPGAGTNRDLADVKFLAHPHRHMFHFKVTVDATHGNRDIEFIQFGNKLKSYYMPDSAGIVTFGASSCEAIAEQLINRIKYNWPNKFTYIEVVVEEDGENGSTVMWTNV